MFFKHFNPFFAFASRKVILPTLNYMLRPVFLRIAVTFVRCFRFSTGVDETCLSKSVPSKFVYVVTSSNLKVHV